MNWHVALQLPNEARPPHGTSTWNTFVFAAQSGRTLEHWTAWNSRSSVPLQS